MAITVDEVQSRIASLVDQSITTPTQTGSEYALRLKYLNRAISEWGQAFDWEALRKDYWPGVTGVSQASISLPDDFHKVAGFPLYYSGGVSGGEEREVINAEATKLYSSTDKYCYVLGDRANGHTLVWSPGTLASGASLKIPYYSYVTSVASPANEIIVSDPGFVVNRVIAYIFESRSDERFQETEVKARESLIEMINSEQVRKFSSYGAGTSKNVQGDLRLYHGFRVGRD